MLKPLPTRSVTRFLLPLADVMTLLFAIFLLMPHLEQQPGPQSARAVTPGNLWVPEEQQQAREELGRLRRLTRLPPGSRLLTVVLDIDFDTGDLLLQQGRDPLRLSDQNVDAVVKEHRTEAQRGERALFYLLRLPRMKSDGTSSRRPTQGDLFRYRRWFDQRKVDYQIERPHG